MLASYHPSALLYLVLARTAAAVRGGGHGASHMRDKTARSARRSLPEIGLGGVTSYRDHLFTNVVYAALFA